MYAKGAATARRGFQTAVACVLAALVWAQTTGMAVAAPAPALAPVTKNYMAEGTPQTAQATFFFPTTGLPVGFAFGGILDIVLRETTPAAATSLEGAPAVLTTIGFLLPNGAVLIGGSVTICSSALRGSDSTSVGFSLGDVGAGTDVSGEWGATLGGEKPINSAGSFDFVSTNQAQTTALGTVNRDAQAPPALDGPQGGMLDDSAARGGLGVVDNAVFMRLTIDNVPGGKVQPLTVVQMQDFLFRVSVKGQTIVEWGSNDAFGFVPAPASLLLVGTSLGVLAISRRKWPTRRRGAGR